MNLIKTQISTGDGVDLFLLFSVGLATTKFAFFVRLTSVAALFYLKGDFMALVRCSECENQVSTNASICPHCGNPLRQTQEVKSITYENKTVRVTCWGLGGSNAIVEKLRPEISAGWEIVSVVEDHWRGGALRHVYTVVLKRARQHGRLFDNVSIFHGEESSQPIFRDAEFENAIKVEVDSHGECLCPKCKKTVTFDPPNCASKCRRCGVLLKPVKKKC